MTVKKLTLRRYQESDIANIEKLQRTQFDANGTAARALIFDWIACHNPVACNERCYLLIEDDNNIVAYEGRMPVDLVIQGKKERGYFFHDTLVRPEYRKKGLGLALVNRLKTNWENETDSFAVGIWMNQFTHEILKRRGYYELNANYYVRPLNPRSSLGTIIKNRYLAGLFSAPILSLLNIYDLIFSEHSQKFTDSQVLRFDQRFDELAEKVSREFNLVVLRDSRYLNWKYIDKPFSNYKIFASEKDNKLAGFVVLLSLKVKEIKTGVIVDILGDPNDAKVISHLCQVAIKQFKQEHTDIISCVLTNRSFIRVFNQHLFFKRRKPVPVMVGNLHKHSAQDIIQNIGNWFITYGDSDGFVWQ